MTYATLQADLISLSHRSDLSAVVPDFIARAEAYLFRELMPIELEDEVTGTVTSNIISLPADFMAIQSLAIDGDYPFTVQTNQIEFTEDVTDGTAYTLYYSASLAPLSISNTSNWLLEHGHDLYLAASLAELARHTKDRELEDKETAKLAPMLESVRSYSNRKKFPQRGGLQIKPR